MDYAAWVVSEIDPSPNKNKKENTMENQCKIKCLKLMAQQKFIISFWVICFWEKGN